MKEKAKFNEPLQHRPWRNKTTSLIRQCKQDYFKSANAKNCGNTKRTTADLRKRSIIVKLFKLKPKYTSGIDLAYRKSITEGAFY